MQNAAKKEIEKMFSQELFIASKLYKEKLSDKMTEMAYYKTLERMCEEKQLSKIAKGIYCKPKTSKYGLIMPSEKAVVDAFTEHATGAVVGYALYNSLYLTTQIPKLIEVYTSLVDSQTKTIGNVHLKKYNINYSKETKQAISFLEVLKHYREIQDINHSNFISFCKSFSKEYDESAMEYVLENITYPKSTISFARDVLNYYGAKNSLHKRLSLLSKYDHPTMEAIYEASRIS